MKYKRRFKWFRSSIEDSDQLEDWKKCNEEIYWDTAWSVESDAADVKPLIVLRVGGKYFVGPTEPNTPREQDIGPYRTLAEAIAAAETMIGLKGSST